jgi:hypothetical protein
MTAEEVIIKVKQRVNKADTDDFDNLSLFSIVEAYNKAQLNVVNYITGQTNLLKQGAEASYRGVDRLSVLLNKTPLPLDVTKENDYWYSEPFPDNYFKYRASYSEGFTPKCSGKKIFHIPVEEANIHLITKNENQNASFEWAEAPVTIAESQLKIFAEDKFDIKKAYLTFYRYPIQMDIAGYINKDGNPSTTVDPEFSDDVVEMCIDEAVRIIQGDIQNTFGIQVASQNLQRGE